eukprot:Plantae.Rhodophyta-Purpureofilum_apyrenoidigerum.ctg1558.p1 GENE.Plantae.Rhodophyta-Purpureofilum_apyrenoidigerum.ctg1558~~Plantae.Rhodophyta-Purpureofilum_apyrenoidigerum.ctg1558.p1  ORF type:complete len:388 (+),score=47.31 Plantae.Rhodophyta-Purpureofilum_apyrenoidigerum.ctg1558:172-1335(+)
MDDLGKDQCWDGMTFSAADEFWSVRGTEDNYWQGGGTEMDASGLAFGDNDEKPFVDDMLLNTDDVDTFWLAQNEMVAHIHESEENTNTNVAAEGDMGRTDLDAHVEQTMPEHTGAKGEPVEVVCSKLTNTPTTNMEAPSLGDSVGTHTNVAAHAAMEMPTFLQDSTQLELMEGLHLPLGIEPFVSVDSELGACVSIKPAVEMQEVMPFVQTTRSGKVPGSVSSISNSPGSHSPGSNSPGDQSPLSNFGAIQDTLMQVPTTKPRKSIKGGKRSGRSVSEKFIVKATPKTRTYANPTASHFCHICWRRAKYTPMAVCANIKQSSCRKVICKKCFACFKWDWDAAVAEGSNFQCTHCLNTCPSGAQCYTYGKTNLKRRSSKTKLPSPASL